MLIVFLQHLFTDERFQSNMESEQQCYWLPMQVLSALHCTSALPDVVQIDIMKVPIDSILIEVAENVMIEKH